MPFLWLVCCSSVDDDRVTARIETTPLRHAVLCCAFNVLCAQANSMPAMFWSLALLLLPEHAEARAKVRQELQDTAISIRQQKQQQEQQQQMPAQQGLSTAIDGATVSAMLQLAMDKRSWVSRCVAEAIRLRLHSIAGGRQACAGQFGC